MKQSIETPITGIVVYRNILSIDEQLQLITIIEETGCLKDSDDNWNYFGMRGRHFSNLNKYDQFVRFCAEKIKAVIETIDDSLVWTPFTHMLTLYYPSSKGMGWHSDSYGGNDGDKGAPVYSLTLGNSCIFEYKLVGTHDINSVELRSGDIIVFGGPQRLMYHRVKSVKMGSFNLKDNFNARINLTLRTCTGFTEEDEARFQTNEYVARLKSKYDARKKTL